MAKRRPSPDNKYRVGQTCALALNKITGWQRYNGQLVTIIVSRVWGEWDCSDAVELPGRGVELWRDWRYTVRRGSDRGEMNVTEGMLRPIYDAEKLSTWEKFAKKTGINLPEACSVAKHATPSRTRREPSHG